MGLLQAPNPCGGVGFPCERATGSPGQCGQGPKLLRGGGSAGTPRACGLHASPQHALQTRVTTASARAPCAQHTCHSTCEHTCTTYVSLVRRWDLSVFAHSLSSWRPHVFEVYRSGQFVRSCPRPHPWAEVGFGLSGPSMLECFLGRAPCGSGGRSWEQPLPTDSSWGLSGLGVPGTHRGNTPASGRQDIGPAKSSWKSGTQDPGHCLLRWAAGCPAPRTGALSHPKARLSLPPPTGFPGSNLTLGKPRALKIKSTLEKQQGPVANSS